MSTQIDFPLLQNYPNPFNPSTTINHSLPYESNLKIIVYNLVGEVEKVIVNASQQIGFCSISFNGVDLSSGFYF